MLIDAFDMWTRDAGESNRNPAVTRCDLEDFICAGWWTAKEVNRKEEMQKGEVSREVRLTNTIRSTQTETKEMIELHVTYTKLPVVERALNICMHKNSQKQW